MSGRHKFSELEAAMTPARRARVREIAEKLEADVARTVKRPSGKGSDEDAAETVRDGRRKMASS
jgi:hypothetical protein